MEKKTIISREDYVALGQAIWDRIRTARESKFEVTSTQQITLGKKVTVDAGGKRWKRGTYVVADGEWY